MKTGSLNMPRILGKASLMKVSGGLNFNYQPPPINQTLSIPMPMPTPTPQPQNPAITLSGIGGTNLHGSPHYQYQVNANVALPNVNLTGGVAGNNIDPINAGYFSLAITIQ